MRGGRWGFVHGLHRLSINVLNFSHNVYLCVLFVCLLGLGWVGCWLLLLLLGVFFFGGGGNLIPTTVGSNGFQNNHLYLIYEDSRDVNFLVRKSIKLKIIRKQQ